MLPQAEKIRPKPRSEQSSWLRPLGRSCRSLHHGRLSRQGVACAIVTRHLFSWRLRHYAPALPFV